MMIERDEKGWRGEGYVLRRLDSLESLESLEGLEGLEDLDDR
jgi:hypothetical protein